MKLKLFLVGLIDFYRKFISPFLGKRCVFYPTCSEYGRGALSKYGALRGLYLLFARLLRCHPWQKKHLDPVP